MKRKEERKERNIRRENEGGKEEKTRKERGKVEEIEIELKLRKIE